MSSKVKKEVNNPHILNRVHSPYYGYGTIIGVSDVDSGYGAVVLFDLRDSSLHSAGDYAKACNESYFPVSTDVRRDRCFWVQVYVSSTEEGSFNKDEVRLVPFDSLEYRQYPIRVSINEVLGDFPETRSASVVAIKRDGDYIVIALDKIEGDAIALPLHSGKGLTAYCDNILHILWPKEDIYYWATTDELSFQEELMGTVSSFDIKEEDNNNNNNKGDEEKADAHVKEEEDTVSSPYYYKIARVEPNELMGDLMSFDQHEGFLWGNIIKYSYRYGNKGEKAETVKKIRKYCDMLLEILEPKSELED